MQGVPGADQPAPLLARHLRAHQDPAAGQRVGTAIFVLFVEYFTLHTKL